MTAHKMQQLDDTRPVALVVSHPDVSKTGVSTAVVKQAAGRYKPRTLVRISCAASKRSW
jgi:hypothetical protein